MASKPPDRPNTTGFIIVAAWGGFLGGFIFLALSHQALFDVDWCAGDAQCFRQWASALSGWVAAIIAGATVLVLLATLKQMQRSAETQTQAYVHASKMTFGAHGGLVVHCKNSGLTPATHFAVNGSATIVKRGTATSSISFKDDDFTTWSVLGSQQKLSVRLHVDNEPVQRFRQGKTASDEVLLVAGQIVYCTIDNHDHVTQFVFYADPANRSTFQRPPANLKSFWRIPTLPS